MLQPILDGDADFVIGSRFVDGGGSEDMPAYRRLGIKVITAASNLSSDLGIQDTQSGFRAFSKLAIERLRFDSEGMELSLEMLEDAHEKDLKIKEVPTVIRYDVPKGSSFTALSHGFTVLAWAMLSLSQKKPLLVLGLPGFGLFAAGAAMGLSCLAFQCLVAAICNVYNMPSAYGQGSTIHMWDLVYDPNTNKFPNYTPTCRRS